MSLSKAVEAASASLWRIRQGMASDNTQRPRFFSFTLSQALAWLPGSMRSAHGDLFHHGQTSKMSNLSHKLITPTKSNYWKALSFCSATFHEYTLWKIGEFHLGGGTFMICIRSSFWCIGYFCQYEFIIGYIYHTIYHTWQFIISRVFFTHDNHWFPFQCFGCQIFPTWGAIAPSHPSS